MPQLSSAEVEKLLEPLLDEDRRARLAQHKDLDFSLDLPHSGRCRVNIHYQRGSLALAIRFVPEEIPTVESLRLPPIINRLARQPQGLVLITGATGQGKSTTLAAMLDFINCHFGRHIITLEDPVEFRFCNKRSVIEQREVGEDTPNFASALRHVLRQAPDVIMVGEMRDQETIAAAITAAETGHLVLGTLHTMTAAGAVERVVDIFEGRQQQQIRVQLAHTLQAVVSQILFRDQSTDGLVPACEILMATSGVRRAIRDNETHLISGMIETGSTHGMQTMDQAIIELVAQKCISTQEAIPRLMSQKSRELLGCEDDIDFDVPIPLSDALVSAEKG
jgi:twitching motility protein PilT